MHLNLEDLVDIAEGTRAEPSAPHLARCEACRAQLHDLRATLAAAKDVGVPEPSPLFWDHLSSRVSDAVAAEQGGARVKSSPYFWSSVAVAAGLVLIVLLRGSTSQPVPAQRSIPIATAVLSADDPATLGADDDPSLTLVASLTDDQDIDTVREAGLAPRGSAEHAVVHMSDDELRELGRLLREELGRSGA